MKLPSGIRIKLHKEQSLLDPRIRPCEAPRRVVLPFDQAPLVSVGDSVLRGQKITDGILPLHATISGTVTAIEPKAHPEFGVRPAIEIESDSKDQAVDDLGRERLDSEVETLRPNEIRLVAREAGIFDLETQHQGIQTIILNGSESEPYLTANYLLMLTKPVEILRGLEFLMRATGAGEAVIAVQENQRECYELFASKMFTYKIPRIRLQWLKDNYPQGFDFQLRRAGASIFTVGELFALYEAVKFRKPYLEKVITLAGSCLIEPQNLWVRFGTSFQEAIDQSGGFLRFPASVIMGGPMMGIAQDSLDVPVLRSTSGILAFPKEEVSLEEAGPCIRCGDCIPVCPVSLNPVAIVEAAIEANWRRAAEFYPEVCIECGNCSYVCPSKIPMVDLIQEAKAERWLS